MVQRTSKLASADEAVAGIPGGSTVAVGGLSYYGAPMELVRALIRRKTRNLTLVTAAVTSIQADLLIAAGCVRKIISSYVAFEELGLAPNFRRAAEKKQIEVIEIGEAFLAFGLKAASSGAPFYALPWLLAGSDCARVNPLYKRGTDPFTGKDVLCVPAIAVDWTLLHVRRADAYGNLQHEGTAFMDPLLARASRQVIASCEEVVGAEELRKHSGATTVPAMLVRSVVESRGAAWPTGSFGCYDVDRAEIKRYAEASRNPADLETYLQEVIRPHPVPAESASKCSENSISAERDLQPASKAEIIATEISRSVRDGMFTGAGTGCWEVLAGLRLAQLTHAPNLCFTMGGAGALNPRLRHLPPSLNGDEGLADCEARVGLEELFDLELGGAFDIMFVSGMQMDQYGNVNLVCVGPHDKPAFRGPGTVGLEFAPCVPRWVAFFRSHTKQVFVDKVDFVSGRGHRPGANSNQQVEMPDDRGPVLVITNLAVMDFCPETKRMRLKSVHPGCTVDQVKENTGFELATSAKVPDTVVPTHAELLLLRNEIDRGGRLASLIP